MSNQSKAVGYTFACICLWSLIPVVARFGQIGLDNYQFLFWSSTLSLIVLLISTFITDKWKSFKSYTFQQVMTCFGLGFLGAFLYYLLLYYGYANAQGLEVLVIQYMWPVLIVALSWPILKEKINATSFLSLILGFSGVALVLTKGDATSVKFTNIFLDFIVLLGALSFALFSVLSKKVHYEPFTATSLFFVSAAICSFVSMMFFSEFSYPSDPSSWLLILINGALVNGLSYILWLKALQYGKASTIAPLVFLTPAFAALLIVLFFDEPFYLAYIIGLLFVIIAGLISGRSDKKHS